MAAQAGGDGLTVLFAEDNEHVRPILASELKEAGYSVLVADDGAQALDIIKHRSNELALLVLDVDLPFVSGLECLREARRLVPGMPAVLISGLPDVHGESANQEAVLLRKPFEVPALLKAARAAMARDASTR